MAQHVFDSAALQQVPPHIKSGYLQSLSARNSSLVVSAAVKLAKNMKAIMISVTLAKEVILVIISRGVFDYKIN